MAKFVVFAKRVDPMEARLRVFCMTDDKEDKTLESQEHFTEVAKSRDVEVLEGKLQYTELAGNLIPVTKSGEQLQFPFKAFRENRLPFNVRVKDQHADTVGRALFMREPRVAKGEQPQQPICILNIVLPEKVIPDHISVVSQHREIITRIDMSRLNKIPSDDYNYLGDLRIVDISNLLGEDWIRLATEIGISQQEISTIKEQHPASTAQQAQSMLRMYQVRKQNARNILEQGLRTIKRDDIITKCMKITNYIETSKNYDPSVLERRKHGNSLDNGYEEPDNMKDSESVEELVFQEGLQTILSIILTFDNKSVFKIKFVFFFLFTDNRLQQLREREELKYSAEEKIVEDSESEDDDQQTKRSVAERREQIQKRLSIERQIPASTQKREIVQEITEIKRQSLIEDKKAMHEEEIIMRAPTDNVIKSASIPEPVIKLKSTKKEGGSDVSKSEFDKELQDKFKTTVKVDQSAPIVKEEVTDRSFIDTKIEYDSTVTEKEFKDLEDEIVKKTESIVSHTTASTRFVEQERLEQSMLIKRSLSKEQSDDIIDPQLAAKLNVQKEKIVDFVETEREILSPVKCEIKKTVSTDQIDAELSSKLSKQKEKAERIVEDIHESTLVKSIDENLIKDFQTEKIIEKSLEKVSKTSKLVSSDKHPITVTTQFLQEEQIEAHKLIQDTKEADKAKIFSEPLKERTKKIDEISTNIIDNVISDKDRRETITKTQQFVREESIEAHKLAQPITAKTVKADKIDSTTADVKIILSEDIKAVEQHVIASTVSFLQDAQIEAHKLAQPIVSAVQKSDIDTESKDGTPVKHSTDLFTSEMESDEFYKSIQAKITKKLSKDSGAMQDDIATAGK